MSIVPATIAVQILKETTNAATQYAMCKEHEQTERARIAARLEAQLFALNKNFDAYSAELESYHEQAMFFYAQLTNLLQSPNVTSNIELTKIILQTLQILHAKNFDTRPTFR